MSGLAREVDDADPFGSPAAMEGLLRDLASRADPRADELATGLVHDARDFEREAKPGTWPDGGRPLPDAPAKDLRPPWGRDTARVADGQAFFADWGLHFGAALFLSALPACYGSARGAKALMDVSSALSDKGRIERRLAETGRFLVDVFSYDADRPDGHALDPGERGQRSCHGVRTFHAFARELLKGPGGWEVQKDGEPLNQEELLGTIIAFSFVAYRGMRRLGARIDLDDPRLIANFYTWRVVAVLLGVDERLLEGLDLQQAKQLEAAIREDQYAKSPEGRALGFVLLDMLEDKMPIGFRKVPRTFLWHCTSAEGVPEVLGLPRPAWWGGALRWIDVDADGWLSRVVSWFACTLTARIGRAVFIGFVDANTDGDGRQWDVPRQMKESLHVRTGRLARKARRTRRVARRAMRRLVPNPPLPPKQRLQDLRDGRML